MAAPLANPGPVGSPGAGFGGGWRSFLGLPVPALCWEFLRRNPSYREDFARAVRLGSAIDRRWGLSAAADPELSADEGRVVWRADVAPGIVVPMERATFGSARRSPLARLSPIIGDDGAHVRLPSGLQVQLRDGATSAGPLVVVLSYDADFRLRVRAVDALRRADTTETPPRSRLSSVQQERLARALGALDGVQSHRSYREIAAQLFGDIGDLAAFKTSSVRDVTIRLVRRGRALMAGGYLKLLRGGF
ncbi:DNA -binding domain-containing protein [Caulobacter sp. UC70_42]|uniref:DNA -binding domain-containing protein n=1 Tax=Caulobacter sp. UC70_42 TaxID=3374551 RepID=UPI0037569032